MITMKNISKLATNAEHSFILHESYLVSHSSSIIHLQHSLDVSTQVANSIKNKAPIKTETIFLSSSSVIELIIFCLRGDKVT